MLSACTVGGAAQKNIQTALPIEFKVQKYHTSTFTLHGLLRAPKVNNDSLHVYIEGDGLAWISRTKPSTNPTPTDDVTLSLAKHDPSNAAVLYLARPCQYVQGQDRRLCQRKFWTSHRLAPEVITALNEAIDKAKQDTNAKDVVLVGFSGGGAAAVLVAAKRNDVKFLGSVAGLLDHEKWTNWHNVSPLSGSLNPVEFVQQVQSIPQKHISGLSDDIVPTSTQDPFCKKLNQADACESIAGVNHYSPWYQYWNYNY